MIPSHFRSRKPAIVMAGSGQTITFGELEDYSNQFAHLMRSLGLSRGDTIALCLENHPYFLPICWGALRAGLYFTAISYRLAAAEVLYIVNDCQARVLITSALLTETFEGFYPDLTENPDCFMLDGNHPNAAGLMAALAGQPKTPITDESYGQSLLYSSGTTGRPKGVKKPLFSEPFGSETSLFRAAQTRYDFNEATIYLSPAPLYHAAPLGFTLNVLRYGGCVIVMPQFDPETALQLLQDHNVTHAQFVPTMFVRMLKLPDDLKSQYTFPKLRYAIHAAAPCPVSIKHQMIDWWGPIIYEYYAGTEGNGSTFIDAEEWLLHPGSVGRAANECRLHILDDDGLECPTGTQGGVYFEGGGQFEYLNDPEKTANSHQANGWSTLGDIGYLDDAGYLYLTDRKSFMIISGGVNIYPQEAENVLITHPLVADVAVFGVPNEEFGEAVKAVVQPMNLDDASPELAAELILYARSQIAHFKCPKTIDFLAELPRHPTGKLYKRLLKDTYWQQTS
ncbi:MAG: acyl-CoA synthetase [Pseudomonadales bacterium]|jgi:long-chain acyl-CoA synthetase